MPNSRFAAALVMPRWTCRYSARVTQVGEPGSACAAPVIASGAAMAVAATRPRMIFFMGLLMSCRGDDSTPGGSGASTHETCQCPQSDGMNGVRYATSMTDL